MGVGLGVIRLGVIRVGGIMGVGALHCLMEALGSVVQPLEASNQFLHPAGQYAQNKNLEMNTITTAFDL